MRPVWSSSRLSALDSRLARLRRARAFTLVELAVAIGVVAVGLAMVIGLFAPVSKSVTHTTENELAARAAERALAYLKTLPWAASAVPGAPSGTGLLKSESEFTQQLAEEGQGAYNPATDARVLFVNRTIEKVGTAADAVWAGGDREKYFEVTCVRIERLSPTASDATAPMLAFTLRVRWPTFAPLGNGATQIGYTPTPGRGQLKFDHSQKDVLFVTGSLSR